MTGSTRPTGRLVEDSILSCHLLSYIKQPYLITRSSSQMFSSCRQSKGQRRRLDPNERTRAPRQRCAATTLTQWRNVAKSGQSWRALPHFLTVLIETGLTVSLRLWWGGGVSHTSVSLQPRALKPPDQFPGRPGHFSQRPQMTA